MENRCVKSKDFTDKNLVNNLYQDVSLLSTFCYYHGLFRKIEIFLITKVLKKCSVWKIGV
jgi:hypothetical protein